MTEPREGGYLSPTNIAQRMHDLEAERDRLREENEKLRKDGYYVHERELAKIVAERDQLREEVERAVQFLPLTRVGSSPSEQTNNAARAGAMLRAALRVVRAARSEDATL